MSGLQLPPPELPDDDVFDVLHDLRDARGELVDARRVAAMVAAEEPDRPHTTRRQWVEMEVAQRRVDLWAAEVRTLEVRAREMGAQL